MHYFEHPVAPPAARKAVQPLGFLAMDYVHEEFDRLLAGVGEGNVGHWVELLAEINAHLRSHFELEDRWMVETDFPPRDCHMDEHAAVLKSSCEVLALARERDFSAAPSFFASLADWFPEHADHLDSALAAWMCKQRYGAKPVVIHRRQGAGAT